MSFVQKMVMSFLVQARSGQLRKGQAWMNALAEVAPDLYGLVSGTEADCFYDDGKIPAFERAVFGEAPDQSEEE